MNKKILISLTVIGVVAAIAIGGTIAYFNDTETSTGNIFVAGSIDLKVDHVKQTYNDVDCKTCSVLLISDEENNMVTEKDGVPFSPPYNAVYVSNPHPRWTAQNDPELLDANAQWIWEDDPTKQADTQVNTTYVFENNFEWWGPIIGSDLYMAVGSDNSVVVYLNGVEIGRNDGEFGYQMEHMLHVDGSVITANTNQGSNILRFEITNWGKAGSSPSSNPAGLVYKFEIDGLCEGDYFKTHCTLWGEKDLEDETFYNFDDIKPGDYGVNVISLHAYSNDAYACLITHDIDDQENDVVDPEVEANDPGAPKGELSQFIKIFAWEDDGNGIYELGEDRLLEPNIPLDDGRIPVLLTASQTKYIGVAWCAGTQSITGSTISCNGSSMGDIAQTDSFTASVTAYVEQQRNNSQFSCETVVLLSCETVVLPQ